MLTVGKAYYNTFYNTVGIIYELEYHGEYIPVFVYDGGLVQFVLKESDYVTNKWIELLYGV